MIGPKGGFDFPGRLETTTFTVVVEHGARGEMRHAFLVQGWTEMVRQATSASSSGTELAVALEDDDAWEWGTRGEPPFRFTHEAGATTAKVTVLVLYRNPLEQVLHAHGFPGVSRR